jgi:2-polyprenyl-3-methyl-5-hydroxy-6-metoxy-1,4-benzoquinol methylase
MEGPQTREPQYQILFDVLQNHGQSKLGLMINESWNQDPRRALFTLARYKFVSKMLSSKKNVLEIGCADAFGTRLVQQEVTKITVIDFDPLFIADVEARANPAWPLKTALHDILEKPFPEVFDAVYALDVLEHIHPSKEAIFFKNLLASLTPVGGVAILGMPSLESQIYASPQSKAGHVNCKSGAVLKECLMNYFKNVFMFSMNDEVIHTGFLQMAHYLLAVCVL